MKNKEFFYLQYNKINWQNQEKTKINALVNNHIIQNIILKNKRQSIKIFDIGFGIGFFMKMLSEALTRSYNEITLAGCEPSKKNYDYFIERNSLKKLETYNKTFQEIKTSKKFDFITAIYVFPHFTLEDLDSIAKKINSMLETAGKFILVVANEKYLKGKLRDKRDLFIEKNTFRWNGKEYWEVLHYSDIPEIGKVIDYNREESFYIDLFEKYNFRLAERKNLDDKGFICTVFVFEKK